MKNKKIVVCGSLAYDRIMDFPGKFEDQILPEKIHILNVSFTINKLKESFGGTAGNISYNLSLLGEKPILATSVGADFFKYREWLKKNKIDTKKIKLDGKELTASAYIITDQSDNQITGFYPGSKDISCCQALKKIKNIDLAIISPDCKERMLEFIKIFKVNKVPYIFDPGQQITSFSAKELLFAINLARVLIGNDYEIEFILKRLKLDLEKIRKLVKIVVITKGADGSEIYNQGKKIKIPSAKPKNTSDPTGAGDAYRAGFIKGLVNNWPFEKIGKLASLVAVYTVEKYGTQTHNFNMKELARRYKENFKEDL
ncbi:MAG: carbohydrate kinase family protein [Patescibacteria group bacterium]